MEGNVRTILLGFFFFGGGGVFIYLVYFEVLG